MVRPRRGWLTPVPERYSPLEIKGGVRLARDSRGFLLDLLAAGGTAGAEVRAADVVRDAWGALADEVGGDALGNVWAVRRGVTRGRPVLLAAHLDVIGLVVTRLLPGGFLRFAPIGGIDPRSLLGREVVVAGRTAVPAVVATLPPHVTTTEGRRKIPALDQLLLDTGEDDATLPTLVRPGDRAYFSAPPMPLMADCLTGAGLDNRAGVAALHEALLTLAGRTPPVDVYVLANVQEEVGLRGIAPAGRQIRPQAAVVVDVGFARQVGAEAHLTLPAGRGPVLGIGPALHPLVTALLADEAERRDLRLQREVFAATSGTDAWGLQVAAGGIPVGLLSIPLRSMHTPAECVDFGDVGATGALLAAFAEAATPEWLGRLTTRLLGGQPS